MASQSSPLKLLPSKRPKLSFDIKKCIICQTVTDHKLVVSADRGTNTLTNAASKRRDEVLERLNTVKEDKMQGQSKSIVYHKACYTSFTSYRNLSHVSNVTEADKGQPVRKSQRTDAILQKDVCLICQKKSHKKIRQLINFSTSNREKALRDAAQLRGDDAMLLRLGPEDGPDLVAQEAVYHSPCLSTYISKRNVKFCSPQTSSEQSHHDEQDHDRAFTQLLQDIHEDLMIHGKAYKLSVLLDIYRKNLPETANKDSYKSDKLERKLLSHYGDTITVHTDRGQGKSNIVHSSKITLKDTVFANALLKQRMHDNENELAAEIETNDTDTYVYLHRAVGMLKTAIQDIEITADYPSSREATLEASKQFVPDLLQTALKWLIDDAAFESGDPKYESDKSTTRKYLSLAECVITSSRKIITPFSLGLAVQMHHDYGKRNIIDTLNSYGLCISYDELRIFMSSAAEHTLQNNTDFYIPPEIISVASGGSLIHEGDDNIDINAETVDGKNTFHSMARVIFQQQTNLGNTREMPKIKRGGRKSLSLDNNPTFTECRPYSKPTQRPEPPRLEQPLRELDLNKAKDDTIRTNEVTWLLLRMMSRQIFPQNTVTPTTKQVIPFWTGYNTRLSEQKSTYTAIAYAPIIEAKPADMATVYTTMSQCKEMTNALGQTITIQTMDQQLYAIGMQVKWADCELFDNTVLRLGGFHTVCTFIACIGKLWGDAGLLDLLVESNVYASITAAQMLAGKQHNRAVRGLTIAFEALLQLFLDGFIQQHHAEIPVEFWEELQKASTNFSTIEDTQTRDSILTLEKAVSEYILPLLETYRKQGSEASPTFKFWVMFLDTVTILLMNVHAEREGNWQTHVQSTRAMLPFFFICNRTNYARWAPVYMLTMLNLPSDVRTAFLNGQFPVRQTVGKFNGIWSDMGTEKTIIRDAKGDSGIVGLTRKRPAMVRWTLTRHIMGSYSRTMKERSGVNNDLNSTVHEQSNPAAMERDESHVQALVKHLKENMTNPFDTDNHPDDTLVNISTGLHANPSVKKSLLGSVDKGFQQCSEFIESRLSLKGQKSFYDPISRSDLTTFSDMTMKTKIASRGQKVSIQMNSELLFRRALTIAQSRDDLTLSQLFKYPITPIPTSIFHDDGVMRKTNKADLAHKLEEEVTSLTDLPVKSISETTYIRDAMAVVQAMDGDKYKTFDDLAHAYLQGLVQCLSITCCVIDIFDRYDNPESVKTAERDKRESSGPSSRNYQVLGGRSIPPWRKFLNNASNKASLAMFLCGYIERNASLQLKKHRDKSIVLAGGFQNGCTVKRMSDEGEEELSHLFSSQEEADTRIVLHSCEADRLFREGSVQGRIIVQSSDTDVLVLLVNYFAKLQNVSELWFKTGRATSTANKRRYIPIHNIAESLGEPLCNILPALHCLTGCDSVSSFYGIGKKTALKLVKEADVTKYCDLAELGDTNTELALKAAENFVMDLYDPKPKKRSSTLTDLRVKLAKAKSVPLSKLPPSEPSFRQHVLRAMWQTRVWMNSHVACVSYITPVGHGWEKADPTGKISPKFFDGPTAAEFIDGILCTCTRQKEMCKPSCSCVQSGLSCTELCPCSGLDKCVNLHQCRYENIDECET